MKKKRGKQERHCCLLPQVPVGLPGDSQNTVDMTVSSSTTSQQLIQQAVKRMDKPVDSTHLKLLVTNKNTKGQSVPMVVGDLIPLASSFSLKSFLSCSKMASLAASCCSRVVILSLCCSVVTQWYHCNNYTELTS